METEIKVEFSIYHDFLNHEEITDIIGFQPTSNWNKGDEIRKNLFHKESAWIYSTGNIKSLFLENILDKLVNKLEIRIVPLSEYMKKNQLKCKFDIILWIRDNKAPSHYLSNKFIHLCDRLNAEIDTDILF